MRTTTRRFIFLANVKNEPLPMLARLLRSRRRDSMGNWLWRLVCARHGSELTG